MDTVKLRVKSGQFQGRWVGEKFKGMKRDEALRDEPEFQILGTDFSLYLQKGRAFPILASNSGVMAKVLSERIHELLREIIEFEQVDNLINDFSLR